MTERRWNALRQEWVAAAPHRQDRTFLPPADQCPFCVPAPGAIAGEVRRPYEIAVFDNRFAPFLPGAPDPKPGSNLQPAAPASGRCEVVLYSSDHAGSLARADRAVLEHLIAVWTDRYRVLSADSAVAYVFIFENRGQAVGVTLDHPHGQIYAYPFVPSVALGEQQAARNHRRRSGECLHCALIAEEIAGPRQVFANARFAVYCPFAARFPYEAHIAARSHLPSLAHFGAADRRALAQALGGLIRAYDRLWGWPLPYVMSMHQQATLRDDDPDTHFHIEFTPLYRTADKLKYLAGSETGAGVFVTDVLPEQAAESLRDALDPAWSLR